MFHHSKSIVHIWTFIALTTSLLGSALTFTPAHAASIVVNTGTDKVGLNIYDGLCSLREAITNANTDAATYPDCPAGSGTDTITFAANYNITLLSELAVTSPIIINGNGAGNTILQANASPNTAAYRLFKVSSTSNLTLDSLTVRNGRCNGSCDVYTDSGGGILNSGILTVTNSTISGNTAASGGGIANVGTLTMTSSTLASNNGATGGGGMYSYASSPTLTNVTFSGNSVTGGSGGGMYNYESNPTLTNVTFSGNSATNGHAGGGMYNDESSPTLTNVTFHGNAATGDNGNGGGMLNSSYSSPKLTNVTFSGNSADLGGGMGNNDNSSPTLTNVTFSSNFAHDGGGMDNYNSSSPTLTNVTFHSNAASLGDGGVMNNNAGSSPLIYNGIFWDGISEIVNDSTSTSTIKDSIVSGGCPAGATCNHVLNSNPLLGALADNGGFTQTMALGGGSPATDTGGQNSTCATYDQRGVKRPQDGNGDLIFACDMGAYEAPSIYIAHSQGANDGWVLESAKGSGLGGALNSADETLLLGDDANNRQYRSVTSFYTAPIPDTATFLSAYLRLKFSSVTPSAGNPISTFQGILADVRNGYFFTVPDLQPGDFQFYLGTPAIQTVGPFSPALAGGYYTINLGSSVFGYINKTTNSSGLTQIRLRFKLATNNNNLTNTLNLISGNDATAANQPAMIIYYIKP